MSSQMISSNSKIYMESIRNPTVTDFDYSFNQLNGNRDLEFKPSLNIPLPKIIVNSTSLIMKFIQNFRSPQHHKVPEQIKHLGVQINEVTEIALDQLIQIIKFSMVSDIEYLTISTAPRDKDQVFINELKFYLGLGHGQYGNIFTVNFPQDNSRDISQDDDDENFSLSILFNSSLDDLDAIIASEVLRFQDDGELDNDDRKKRIRYLDEFTLPAFQKVLSDIELSDNVQDGNIV